jgi:dienelactone hydrolase
MYGYDTAAPLDVRTLSTRERDGVQFHDVSYASPPGSRVTGYLVVPPGTGPFPALLFLHWGFGGRDSFLSEARAYARAGALSLLIDAPGFGARQGDGRPRLHRVESAQRFLSRCLTDLRRGVDLLCSREDVDARRLAYVGHSLGSSVGGQLAGVEPRLGTCVLMAGFGELSRGWSLLPDAGYTEAMRPHDGIRHIGASKAAFFFQFATRDEFISREAAQRFYAAAPEPKLLGWYEADHRMGAQALHDRAAWLGERLGLTPPHDSTGLRDVKLPSRDVAKYYVAKPVIAAFSLFSRSLGARPTASP